MRVGLLLSVPQKKKLDKRAKDLGITFSEFVRRLLDSALQDLEQREKKP